MTHKSHCWIDWNYALKQNHEEDIITSVNIDWTNNVHGLIRLRHARYRQIYITSSKSIRHNMYFMSIYGSSALKTMSANYYLPTMYNVLNLPKVRGIIYEIIERMLNNVYLLLLLLASFSIIINWLSRDSHLLLSNFFSFLSILRDGRFVN